MKSYNRYFAIMGCVIILSQNGITADTESSLEAGQKNTPLTTSVRYEPLEIESPTNENSSVVPTPWYKSKRFWCGAAVVTAGIAAVAGITYAVTKSMSSDGSSDHPFGETPTMSPLPSFIQNITDSASDTCSSTLSSLASRSSSWTSSLSEALSAAASESMSALKSLTSSVTRTMTGSPNPSSYNMCDGLSNHSYVWKTPNVTFYFTNGAPVDFPPSTCLYHFPPRRIIPDRLCCKAQDGLSYLNPNAHLVKDSAYSYAWAGSIASFDYPHYFTASKYTPPPCNNPPC